MVADRPLRRFLEGLAAFADGVRDYIDDVRDDLEPARTRALASWEREFGLSSAGTTAQRVARLEAAWADGGGQSPAHLQETVEAAGFPLCLHEWWTTDVSPRTAYDPRNIASDPLSGTTQCTASVMLSDQPQCLDTASATSAWPQPQCDAFLANETKYLVNLLHAETVPPRLPASSALWHQFAYWAGSRYVREVPALIDGSLRGDLERLLLKLKPAQSWVVANVDYYAYPEALAADGYYRWSPDTLAEGTLAEWVPHVGDIALQASGSTAILASSDPVGVADAFEGHLGAVMEGDDYFITADVSFIDRFLGADPWSVAMCLRKDGSGEADFVRLVGNTYTVYPMWIRVTAAGAVSLRLDGAAGTRTETSAAGVFVDGRVHTLVVTYDGAGSVNLYVDGENVHAASGTHPDLIDGREVAFLFDGVDGAFADVAVFERELSSDDAAALEVYWRGRYSNAVIDASPLERWSSDDLAKGVLQSWDGEYGLSTVAPDSLGEYPVVDTRAFGTLQAVAFGSDDQLADTSVASSIASAMGSSFSVGWFGTIDSSTSGILVGAAVVDGLPDVQLTFSPSVDEIELSRVTGGPLLMSGGVFASLDLSVPHAWVVTYDRPSDTLSVYVDGALLDSVSAGGASDIAGVTCLYLGGGAHGGPVFKSSDVVLFDGALSESTAMAVSSAMARKGGACSLALVEDIVTTLEYNQIKAVSVRPPRQGECYRVAVSTTEETVYLPGAGASTVSSFDTHFVSLRAVGADVQIQFGVVGDTLDIDDDHENPKSGDPDVLTADSEVGITLKDGEERSFRLSGENQLTLLGKGTGFVELWRSSHDHDAA